MALADIIGRIESDAGAEARTVLESARSRAAAMITEAQMAAAKAAEEHLGSSERRAHSEAQTLLANARLSARDEALAAKRALIDRVLAEAEVRLVALPDAEYRTMIARGVARQARGGDTIWISPADVHRLTGLPEAADAIAGRGLGLRVADEPADLERGVILSSDRVSSVVSARSLLEARRDRLVARVAGILFEESKGA